MKSRSAVLGWYLMVTGAASAALALTLIWMAGAAGLDRRLADGIAPWLGALGVLLLPAGLVLYFAFRPKR